MRGRRILVGALVIGALAAGCSGGDGAQTTGDAETAGDTGIEGATDGAAAGSDDVGEAFDEGGDGIAAYRRDRETGDPLAVALPLGRKVIRTADLTLEVDDGDAAVDAITRLAERAGGFVATSDLVRDDEGNLGGELTLRVPTDRLTTTLDGLEELAANVRQRTMGSDDVTSEFADIDAQLRNLRALEVELRALLSEIRDRSDSADEVLAVFERIRQVRGEIERLQGRQEVLTDLVDLATVRVDLVPTPRVLPLADDGWSPAATVRESLRATTAVLRWAADAAIWLALTAIPTVLLFAVPFLGALLVATRLRRRDQPDASA